MIAVPDPKYGLIVFDNNVLEVFESNGSSKRFHRVLINSIELNEKKHFIEIKYSDVNLSQRIPFKPDAIDQAQALVNTVESSGQ
ncbi:MAG: hypothetical protein RH862_13445 [Leptospiraceae bacterium]